MVGASKIWQNQATLSFGVCIRGNRSTLIFIFVRRRRPERKERRRKENSAHETGRSHDQVHKSRKPFGKTLSLEYFPGKSLEKAIGNWRRSGKKIEFQRVDFHWKNDPMFLFLNRHVHFRGCATISNPDEMFDIKNFYSRQFHWSHDSDLSIDFRENRLALSVRLFSEYLFEYLLFFTVSIRSVGEWKPSQLLKKKAPTPLVVWSTGPGPARHRFVIFESIFFVCLFRFRLARCPMKALTPLAVRVLDRPSVQHLWPVIFFSSIFTSIFPSIF